MMGRRRLLWRLYPTYLGVSLLSLLAIIWYASCCLDRFYRQQRADDLEAIAQVVARYLMDGQYLQRGPAAVAALCRDVSTKSDVRVTVLLASGQVISDSQGTPGTMDNHRDRPEIREALRGTPGTAIRYSDTTRAEMMYVAVPLPSSGPVEAVVRTAVPVRDMNATVERIRLQIMFGGLAVAVVGALGSFLLTRRLIRPLEEMKQGAQRFALGDLATRLPIADIEEIGGLAEAMNNMAAQLDERIRTVTRQRNEQEAILSSMIEGVLAVDTDEHVISLNQSAARILSIRIASVQGRSVQEVVRNGPLQEFISRAIAGPDPVEGEIVVRDPGGERFLQVHGAVLVDASHRGIGAVIVLNDISPLRRLECMRSDFVANVSHELRTPITSIKGFVETLLDGAIDDHKDSRRFLGVIAQQVDRLNAIIEDLLTLSRVEQGGEAALVVQQAKLCEVIRDAVEVCSYKAEEKGVQIHADCPLDVIAQMNAPLIEQAVINLIDNAVKYSEPGASIEIVAATDQNVVHIVVSDHGCGIGREHLPRVFERFYRVDKARSRKLGGTGLGLAIVKHIVQAHGGRVTVESTLGKGSTFTIHLPQGDKPS